MRILAILLAALLSAGGCTYPTAVKLHTGEKVDSFYYHERRAADELMIEMWIDFATRRLRFKCGPHDALGWDSRRFDSWRLDVALSRRELCRIAASIMLAKIESWESVDGKDAASTLDKPTYYVRMKTANGMVERFVAGAEPKGFAHLKGILSFAASHASCRYEKGERAAETTWKMPYGQCRMSMGTGPFWRGDRPLLAWGQAPFRVGTDPAPSANLKKS